MRDNIVAITMAGARSQAEHLVKTGAPQRDVALTTMRACRNGFMAPDESEAFAAAVGVLWELYPDDEQLRQETRAIGDRNKIMAALAGGVPVDFDRVELTDVPEDALGLLELWRESEESRAARDDHSASRRVDVLERDAPHLIAFPAPLESSDDGV